MGTRFFLDTLFGVSIFQIWENNKSFRITFLQPNKSTFYAYPFILLFEKQIKIDFLVVCPSCLRNTRNWIVRRSRLVIKRIIEIEIFKKHFSEPLKINLYFDFSLKINHFTIGRKTHFMSLSILFNILIFTRKRSPAPPFFQMMTLF